MSPSIKLTQWGGLERGASALLPLVLIRCEGGHLLLDNVLHLAGSEDADPLLCALNGTWNMIFRGEFDSPAGLKVATPDMPVRKLGDFVAFCASHGCSPKAGTGRMLGLAVLLLQQVGDALALDQFRTFVLPPSCPVCWEVFMLRLASSHSVKALQATPFFPRMLSKCTSDDLPLIRMIQQKQPSDQKDDLGQEQRDAGEIDDRIYCLASFKETWGILSRAASDHCRKSLCIVADAGDVAGAPVELFFAYSPVCERGALLPHQVGGELVRPRLPGPFQGSA